MSENMKTVPGVSRDSFDEDDPFARTAVLPPDAAVTADDSDGRLQIGSVLRDRFLLQERVAAGGMGVVYKALDRRMAEVDGIEPWVAIKVLSPKLSRNPNALRAIQQEAAKGRCLSHPNIVRFIDLDREDDLYFIVMEWLEGRSLADVLDSGEGLPDRRASLDIIRQVGEALGYAHRCGVIHADVKPGNIMVLPSGAIKLFDFGIARIRQQQDAAAAFNPGVLAAATPAYSSMQVLTGEEPVAADDVFSLACLAYRLIAGHRVFGPRNAAEAAESGMEPQRPKDLPDAQWKALRKALSHSRVTRHATPGEFLDALLGASGGDEPEPPRFVPLEVIDDARHFRADEESSRRRWPYVVALLLAAVIAASVVRPSWFEELAVIVKDAADGVIPAAAVTPDREPAAEESAPAAQPTVTEQPAEAGDSAVVDDRSVREGEIAGMSDAEGTPYYGATPDPDANAAAMASAEDPAAGGDGDERAYSEQAEDGASSGAADFQSATTAEAPPAGKISATQDSGASNLPDDFDAGNSLMFSAPGEERPELDVTVVEGNEPLVINLYRWFGLDSPLTVRIDEVGFSGNRSPGAEGRYRLSGDDVISFDRGQREATLTVSISSNDEREPDRQVALLLRDYYNVNTELGQINLGLLDDDQRRFEANHAVNTVVFTSAQVSVSERDPAVQIDVTRLNPDQTTLNVVYTVEDITATEGEDYFAPGRKIIVFGPGQRVARLLIPLVQDAAPEDDEAFTIELDTESSSPGTFTRIAVIIRDDD
ncbi:MAG: protein kinase [Woeseiaceae bacterium]|nr:protein kinase [Woeseiaceae bacterium]